MPEDDRTFITIHDGVHDHPKVVGLSDAAFRWWHELICWCSKNRTDGRVPRAQWMKAKPKVRRELLEAVPGYDPLVIDRGDHGVEVHDYLEHQRSAAQIAEVSEQKKRAGAKGNHDRWHVGPKGRRRDDCPLCQQTPPGGPGPSHNGSHPRSQNGSQVRSQKASQNGRETSPETEEFLRNSLTDPEKDPENSSSSARDAADLVDRHAAGVDPAEHRQLTRQVTDALVRGIPADIVGDALDDWMSRTRVTAGLLPRLVTDAVKRRRTQSASTRREPDKVDQWAAIAAELEHGDRVGDVVPFPSGRTGT